MSEDRFEFGSLRRAPLPFQVAEQIRERIKTGGLKPDMQLPSERKLCEAFNVSRVAVREAIQLLQAQRYVDVQHGKGIYVVDPSVRQTSSLTNWLSGRSESLRMMAQMRKIVEPGIAELAATSKTPQQAARLLELAHELETGAPEQLSEIDASFHREIATTTGNTLLMELVASCLERTEPLRLRTLRDTHGRDLAAKGHVAIAEAIAAGKPSVARAAMEAHMNDALRSI